MSSPNEPIQVPNRDIPISQAHHLFTSFTSFLTVAVHTIIYYRDIYPKQTFLSVKAYNLPVHQSRHPKVCSWIKDAVDAVITQIAKGNVTKVAVVIHAPLVDASKPASPSPKGVAPGSVLERWMFDVSRFPAWPGGIEALNKFRGEAQIRDQEDADGTKQANDKQDNQDEGAEEDAEQLPVPDEGEANANKQNRINWTDVDEQFRGALMRLANVGTKLDSVPQGCTFTVAVELREDGEAPIGHPQPWIPSQPSLQPASSTRPERGEDLGGANTVPIRSIAAGPLFLECWVEEGKAKEALRSTPSPG